MEQLLEFFSNLLLFTGGLVVAVLWIVLIMIISIEVWDMIFEKDQPEEEEEA